MCFALLHPCDITVLINIIVKVNSKIFRDLDILRFGPASWNINILHVINYIYILLLGH